MCAESPTNVSCFLIFCAPMKGDTVINTIAAELMGRYSNLVLIQKRTKPIPHRKEKIIDALKRVDFEDSEVRQLLPGLLYQLPLKPVRAASFLIRAQWALRRR